MKFVTKYFVGLSAVIVGLGSIGCNKAPTSHENDGNNNKSTIAAKMVLPEEMPREALNYTN